MPSRNSGNIVTIFFYGKFQATIAVSLKGYFYSVSSIISIKARTIQYDVGVCIDPSQAEMQISINVEIKMDDRHHAYGDL